MVSTHGPILLKTGAAYQFSDFFAPSGHPNRDTDGMDLFFYVMDNLGTKLSKMFITWKEMPAYGVVS
jgi:hypothetical protein